MTHDPQARLKAAAQALLDAFGGNVPDWLRTEANELQAAIKAKPSKPYYSLLTIDGSPGCPWSAEFGDYDLTTVKDELDDYRSRGWKKRDLKIITTGETQAEIDAAVATLNEGI